jgi:nickel transport protein
MKKLIPLFCLFLFSINTGISAHGIHFETGFHAPAVTVRAYFSRTAPLADASVTVYAPGEEKPYQSGRTDRDGYFAFLPVAAGNWTLTVDDGMGHADKVIVSVTGGFLANDEPGVLPGDAVQEHIHRTPAVQETRHFPLGYRVLLGLALIFGITGIIYAVKASQELKKVIKGN